MNKRLNLAMLLVASSSLLAGCSKTEVKNYSLTTSNPSDGLTSQERNKERSRLLADQAWKDYFDEALPASYEYYPFRDETEELASAWHYTSIISLYNKLLTLYPDDAVIKGRVESLYDGLEYYRENRNDYRVYAVNRGFKKKGVAPGINTNVYDDNEWLAREFLNTYEITGDESYLNGAKELVSYILDNGWDHSINSQTGEEWGGLYWGPYYTSKHTCSNAPLVGTLVKLSEISKDNTYLDWAKKIYDFSYKTFREEDNCYGDLIGTERDENGNTIAHGSLDTTEYTYNTGTMITGGAELYRVTKEEHYLNEAKASAAASFTNFANTKVLDGYVQFPVSSTLYFNMVLFEGYYSLFKVTGDSTYFDMIQKSIDLCFNSYLYGNYLPVSWCQGWIYGLTMDEYKDVRDVHANAETYAMLSLVDSLRK